MDTITLGKKKVIETYMKANKEDKKLLEAIFGKDLFNNSVQERVKTFEDACNELGEGHDFVRAYRNWETNGLNNQPDIEAYLKLRIIAAALNEGWEPQFTKDEWRYFPYFVFYTQEEIDKMSEETKARVVRRSGDYAVAYGGVAYAYAYSDSSDTYAGSGSRLAFRSRELAEYAGKQFVDICADFVWK